MEEWINAGNPPEPGKPVLVVERRGKKRAIRVGFCWKGEFHGEEVIWWKTPGKMGAEVDWWMPLPEMPEE